MVSSIKLHLYTAVPRIDRAKLSPLQLKLVRFLQFRLKLPEEFIHALLSVRRRTWFLVLAWLAASHLSVLYQMGPLFIIATGFCAIYFGLGKRKEGEASAYSIFNSDFQELPGTFNANRFDEQLRQGNAM